MKRADDRVDATFFEDRHGKFFIVNMLQRRPQQHRHWSHGIAARFIGDTNYKLLKSYLEKWCLILVCCLQLWLVVLARS